MAAIDGVLVVGYFLVGVFAGGTVGLLVGWKAAEKVIARESVIEMRRADQPVLTDPLMAEMLTRLMDASLPKSAAARAPEPEEYVEPEYEPPMEDVPDWTDSIPELTPQREDWVGVGPGEGVPFMDWQQKGEEMFTSWVEPVDLGDGEVVE